MSSSGPDLTPRFASSSVRLAAVRPRLQQPHGAADDVDGGAGIVDRWRQRPRGDLGEDGEAEAGVLLEGAFRIDDERFAHGRPEIASAVAVDRVSDQPGERLAVVDESAGRCREIDGEVVFLGERREAADIDVLHVADGLRFDSDGAVGRH